MYKRIR